MGLFDWLIRPTRDPETGVRLTSYREERDILKRLSVQHKKTPRELSIIGPKKRLNDRAFRSIKEDLSSRNPTYAMLFKEAERQRESAWVPPKKFASPARAGRLKRENVLEGSASGEAAVQRAYAGLFDAPIPSKFRATISVLKSKPGSSEVKYEDVPTEYYGWKVLPPEPKGGAFTFILPTKGADEGIIESTGGIRRRKSQSEYPSRGDVIHFNEVYKEDRVILPKEYWSEEKEELFPGREMPKIPATGLQSFRSFKKVPIRSILRANPYLSKERWSGEAADEEERGNRLINTVKTKNAPILSLFPKAIDEYGDRSREMKKTVDTMIISRALLGRREPVAIDTRKTMAVGKEGEAKPETAGQHFSDTKGSSIMMFLDSRPTIVHEMGHHISIGGLGTTENKSALNKYSYFGVPGSDRKQKLLDLWQTYASPTPPPTEYGKKNVFEDIAESFTLHSIGRLDDPTRGALLSAFVGKPETLHAAMSNAANMNLQGYVGGGNVDAEATSLEETQKTVPPTITEDTRFTGIEKTMRLAEDNPRSPKKENGSPLIPDRYVGVASGIEQTFEQPVWFQQYLKNRQREREKEKQYNQSPLVPPYGGYSLPPYIAVDAKGVPVKADEIRAASEKAVARAKFYEVPKNYRELIEEAERSGARNAETIAEKLASKFQLSTADARRYVKDYADYYYSTYIADDKKLPAAIAPITPMLEMVPRFKAAGPDVTALFKEPYRDPYAPEGSQLEIERINRSYTMPATNPSELIDADAAGKEAERKLDEMAEAEAESIVSGTSVLRGTPKVPYLSILKARPQILAGLPEPEETEPTEEEIISELYPEELSESIPSAPESPSGPAISEGDMQNNQNQIDRSNLEQAERVKKDNDNNLRRYSGLIK